MARRTAAATRASEGDLTVAVLGAGAPHAALMAGALACMYRNNKTFHMFFTSGGGALMGLLFIAPLDKRPDEALRDVAEFGIDERIYRLFPVGYKTFFKQSWFTRQFHDWAELLKLDVEPRAFPDEEEPPEYDAKEQRRRRLYNDVVDFWASALTPPRLGPTSLGLCTPLPFLEDMIDFSAVNTRTSPSGFEFTGPIPIVLPGSDSTVIVAPLHLGWFWVNAYNLNTKRMESFSNMVPAAATNGHKGSLTPAALRAALSFPSVYQPQEINGALYCEGALIDPLNLPKATRVILNMEKQQRVTRRPKEARGIRFYLFDILGSLEKQLMYRPHSLWEAYGLSILTPVISLANMSRTIFCLEKSSPTLVPVPFEIPVKSRKRPLDWSYANMTALWDAGWEAGERFLEKHGSELPDRVEG